MRHILLLLGIVIILSGCSKGHTHQAAPYDGSKVRVDIGLLKEGIPVFYSFREGELSVLFFVIKVNGEVHSYFDACNECYRNKLGYRYEDGALICNACNVSYSIFKLSDGVAGCYPIKLEGALNGTTYEIDKESLMKGKKYF